MCLCGVVVIDLIGVLCLVVVLRNVDVVVILCVVVV